MNATEKATREAVARTQRESEIKAAQQAVDKARAARATWETEGAGFGQAVIAAEERLVSVLEKHDVIKRAEIKSEGE